MAAAAEDAVIGVDPDGRVTSWNRGATAMFGWPPERAIGGAAVALVAPELAGVIEGMLLDAASGATVADGAVAHLHAAGEQRQVTITAIPALDARRRPVGAALLVRDVTPQRRMADRLHDAQTRLTVLEKQVRSMTGLSAGEQVSATLAHELNQPLSAIANYARAGRRLLDAGAPHDLGQVARALDETLAQTQRASEIIARLGALIARGESDHRLEALPALIDEARRLTALDAARAGARVVVSLDPEARLVLVDRVQIRQILLNLMRNGLQAMDGCARRELTVATCWLHGRVEISVADTGRGVPEAVRDRLFEPFVTTRADGTGLGLMIGRAVAEAHGGALTWQAVPGGGSMFRFTVTGLADPAA